MTHHHDILRLHLEVLAELTHTLCENEIIAFVFILLVELLDRLHVHIRAAFVVARCEVVLECTLRSPIHNGDNLGFG